MYSESDIPVNQNEDSFPFFTQKSLPAKPKGKAYTIYLAARYGDLDRIKELAESWFSSIDKPDQQGWNFLHHAAASNQPQVLEWAFQYYEKDPKKRITLFTALTPGNNRFSSGDTLFELAFLNRAFASVKKLFELSRRCSNIIVNQNYLLSLFDYRKEQWLMFEKSVLDQYNESSFNISKVELFNLQLLIDTQLLGELSYRAVVLVLNAATENNDLQKIQLILQVLPELNVQSAAEIAAKKVDLSILQFLLQHRTYSAIGVMFHVIQSCTSQSLEQRLQIIRYLISEKKANILSPEGLPCITAALASNCPVAVIQYLIAEVPGIVARECNDSLSRLLQWNSFDYLYVWLGNIKQKLPFFIDHLKTNPNHFQTFFSQLLVRARAMTFQEAPLYLELIQSLLDAGINPQNASSYQNILWDCFKIALAPNIPVTFLQNIITLEPNILDKNKYYHGEALDYLLNHQLAYTNELWLSNIKEKLPHVLYAGINLLQKSNSQKNQHALSIYLDRWDNISEQQEAEYFEYLETMLRTAISEKNRYQYHNELFLWIDQLIDQKKYKLAKFLHQFDVPLDKAVVKVKEYRVPLLYKAVLKRDIDAVRFLGKELNVNLLVYIDSQIQTISWMPEEQKGSAFMYAVLMSHFDMVDLFINELKFPISTQDKLGNTALHVAAASGLIPMVRFLLDKCGADVYAENNEKRIAYDLTENSDTRALLLQYMNKARPKIEKISNVQPPISMPTLATPLKEISYQDLSIDERLGAGSFGVVYKGRWSNSDVAIKKLTNDQFSHSEKDEFKKEVTIMARLNHRHIVNLYGVVFEPACIVMEYMSKGSLEQFLHNRKNVIDETLQEQIGKDIAIGLAYLHDNQIIHRDLKSANILLDENSRAKIGDFGLSKIKQETVKSKTQSTAVLGTFAWLPPEMFKKGAKHTYATDVWSFGVTMWEIASRETPFKDEDLAAMVICIKTEETPLEIPSDCPDVLSDVMRQCWQKDIKERPTAQKIISFFNEMRRTKPQPKNENLISNTNSLTTLSDVMETSTPFG